MLDPRLRPLVLASASPQRRTLLAELREPFEVRAADVDETPPPLPLRDVVRELALRKARAIASQIRSGTVIGADTLIELDGAALGKPNDACDAAAMLEKLSGREHAVHTGVALVHRPSGRALADAATTRVRFRPLARDEIAAYVASGEPLGKSGSYAIQGGAARFVERIDGTVDNVVGLPLFLVRTLLDRLRAELPAG